MDLESSFRQRQQSRTVECYADIRRRENINTANRDNAHGPLTARLMLKESANKDNLCQFFVLL